MEEPGDTVPAYASELIRMLDEEIPHRCPSPRQSERDIWMYAGKRKLVDSLLSRLEMTEEAEYTQNVLKP
jgi:hypothetical protein